jgi:hypothetical protein
MPSEIDRLVNRVVVDLAKIIDPQFEMIPVRYIKTRSRSSLWRLFRHGLFTAFLVTGGHLNAASIIA